MERTRLLHTAKHHVQFVRAAEDDQAAGEEHHARKRQRTDGSVDAAQIYQEVLSRPPEPKSAAAPTAQHAARRPPPPKKQAPAKREPTETERQRARLAMLKAAQDGDADGVVQLLREGTAAVDCTDEFGWTPLMVAAAAGHMAAVQALLKGGADPLACDSKQRRASTLAQMQGHSDVLGVLAEAERSRSDGAGKKKARSRKSSGGHARIACDVCGVGVDEPDWAAHKAGTLHIFNEQHAPHHMVNSSLLGGKGYQMMRKAGWADGMGLGVDSSGMQNPVKTVLKRDRHGIGVKSQESQARVTHFQPFQTEAIDDVKKKEAKPRLSKRDQQRQERREKAFVRDLRRYMNS